MPLEMPPSLAAVGSGPFPNSFFNPLPLVLGTFCYPLPSGHGQPSLLLSSLFFGPRFYGLFFPPPPKTPPVCALGMLSLVAGSLTSPPKNHHELPPGANSLSRLFRAAWTGLLLPLPPTSYLRPIPFHAPLLSVRHFLCILSWFFLFFPPNPSRRTDSFCFPSVLKHAWCVLENLFRHLRRRLLPSGPPSVPIDMGLMFCGPVSPNSRADVSPSH